MKDFLKQHYDKVLLLGLFCIFIALMIMVQGIISSTKEITEESLRIPKRKADYKQVDPNSSELNPELQKRKGNVTWNDNDSRNEKLGLAKIADFSDLVSVFPIAKCPHCSTDDRANFIPLSSFSSKEKERNCPTPTCGKHLPIPPERRFANLQSVENDDDRDGISNQDEERHGLNSRNPDDALYDDDKDGFTNVLEITNNFDPKNPKSVPPVWWRLCLKDVKQIELPVRFMKINDNNSDDKSKWLLQFNIKRRKREATEWFSLGEIISIDGRDYKIVDVIRDIRQVKVTEGHQTELTRTEDKSKVVLVEELFGEQDRKADRLEMYAGQPAYSSDKRPVLEDVGFYPPVEYALQIGGVIKMPVMPSSRSNFKRYRVEKVDVEKMSVWIVDLSSRGNRTLIEITKDGKVPPPMRLGEKKRDFSGAEGE